jgi:hypothetical protein
MDYRRYHRRDRRLTTLTNDRGGPTADGNRPLGKDHTGRWVDAKAMCINDGDLPALKVHARNLSVSMRFADAHAGP